MLAIDDAQLLDGPSAGLVHQLASARLTVLATIREGESVHDAVSSLIADGTIVVHELGPLSLEDIGFLRTEALGGPADSGLSWAVHQRSSGHPLTSHVLVREPQHAGILIVDAGERVAFSHPLYRDGALFPLTTAQRHGHLRDSVEAMTPATSTTDRVAVTLWAIELDEPVSLAALTLTSDPAACEVFLRAAVDAQAGTAAVLRLAEVLVHQHDRG